ncbi:MAG: DUF192 domain-containing protein [Candidatus Aminicenantes bacterium]|jgi:uncharacterized membrane protein (UPF0127 family)
MMKLRDEVNKVAHRRGNVIKVSQLLFFSLILLQNLCTAQTQGKRFIKMFFPDGYAITAELAVTDEERQLGLMHRKKINPDQGMLLVFERANFHSIWMKNMKIPLDILWLDKEKRIVHIERDVPPCKEDPCPTYTSRFPAMYVLELKAGSVNEHKLKMYDRIDFVL